MCYNHETQCANNNFFEVECARMEVGWRLPASQEDLQPRQPRTVAPLCILALWDISVWRPPGSSQTTAPTHPVTSAPLFAPGIPLSASCTPPHPALSHHRSVALRLPNTHQATSRLAAHCSSTWFSNFIVFLLAGRLFVAIHAATTTRHRLFGHRAMRPCPVREDRVAVRRLG
jgi:hypothetical protein